MQAVKPSSEARVAGEVRNNVKELRDELDISIRGLERLTGINRGNLSEIERYLRNPDPVEKEQLRSALGDELRYWVDLG
jgi:transcriptional regulator with XRE-family HTH domain